MNYLISCSSYRQILEELNKIIEPNSNINRFDLNFDELDNILEEAAYFSLFDEKKYIIINNADIFTTAKVKYSDEPIINYLNNPNPNTTMIFITYNKLDGKKKIVKQMKEKYHTIEIKNIELKVIHEKIQNLFKSNKFKISSNDIYYIINNSLNNYDISYNNAIKIMDYYDENKEIQHDDIVNLISESLEENNFKFVKAVITKNIKLSMKLLNELYRNKVEPLGLLSLLTREYKMMLQIKELESKNHSNRDICDILKLQDWQLNAFKDNNYSYKESDLKYNLKQLLDIEYKIKSGKLDKKLGLELFILGI